jgi:hypothetical protein
VVKAEEGGPAEDGRRDPRERRLLIACLVALLLVLAVGCCLCGRTVWEVEQHWFRCVETAPGAC